jgi:hypothetical protein
MELSTDTFSFVQIIEGAMEANQIPESSGGGGMRAVHQGLMEIIDAPDMTRRRRSWWRGAASPY